MAGPAAGPEGRWERVRARAARRTPTVRFMLPTVWPATPFHRVREVYCSDLPKDMLVRAEQD